MISSENRISKFRIIPWSGRHKGQERMRAGATRSRQHPGYGRWTPFWFLAPAVLALLAIGIYPTVYAVLTSFRRYNIVRRKDMLDGYPFVGFANYAKVLDDQTFWDSLLLTGRFFLTVVPIQIALGIVIALMLHRPGWGLLRSVTRVSLVVPLATTYAVVGLIGRLIFNRDFGVANQILGWIGISSWDWLGNQTGAFIAIVVMDVWQWTPFVALIFLAGLSMVPVEIEEAARLETKSPWALLRYVQLPYLLPGLTAVLILRSADVLKLFDMVFVMTRGGPGSATDLVSVYVQRVGFKVFDLGLASAQAIMLLILTIVLSRIYIRVFYREIEG
jgi:multiple sugar transport system permease protein